MRKHNAKLTPLIPQGTRLSDSWRKADGSYGVLTATELRGFDLDGAANDESVHTWRIAA